MNVLMITKFVPLPADSGGKRRSLAILRELVKIGAVTLCAFREPQSDVAGLEELGARVVGMPWRPGPAAVARGLARTKTISSARFWDPALAGAVKRAAAAGIDHLQVEYTQLAPYARDVPAGHRALDMHNVESALAASFAATRSALRAPPYRLEAAALRRLERRVLTEFDVVSVVSEADRSRLPGGSRAIVAPNGWDPGPAPAPAADPVAAFVALMGWPPNDDAARWLGGSIWPLVRRAVPGARLLLVGRDPSPQVRSLHGRDGIEVTGTVADVRPYLASARVGLAPLRAGGGSRLKILEALDAGRPVVATPAGAEGLETLTGKGLVLADGAEGLAAAISRLLRDPSEAAELGRRGHEAVAASHSWPATLAPLIAAIEAGASRGGRR